ncbi:MAG TPA: hypothetical protein VEK15_24550 [Vicinamibacteria bacterium]|nr:hypothetical protein [Vicinamibacteria bacterium]
MACLSLLVLVPTLLGREARGGALQVLNGAAFTGDFGLRVTVGIPCTQSDVVVPSGTVSSNQLACNSVTAGNVEVVAPGTTFTAGDRVILQNGFSVASGVSFVARIDPFVKSPFAYVRDDMPTAETTYNAEFSLRVDGLSLAMGDEIGHFVGYSANGMPRFRVVLRRSGSETRAAILAWDDVAGELVEHSTDFLLPLGFHRIHLSFRAGAGDGEFSIAIDGSGLDGLTGLDNGGGPIDFVKWGAVDGTLASSTGWMELDDFSSWR